MSGIEFLAAQTKIGSSTIKTKAGLRELIKASPENVRFVPLVTEPMTPAIHALTTSADRLPFGIPVKVTGPVSQRQWKAEVERKFNGTIVVR